MLRTALRPWSLGLLALALAAATAFAALGSWQLGRSRSSAAPSATERVVPLEEVLAPATSFPGDAVGQRVRVAGEYLPEQLLVAGRALGGDDGSWVLAPLRVPTAEGSALLPVVRGWVAEGEEAGVPPVPAGVVEVTGRLQNGEPPVGLPADGRGPGAAGSALGAVRAVSPADLLNVWDPPIYTGYVVDARAPAPLVVVPSSAPAPEANLRNVSYALQWWLFAAFAVVVWWRVVRDRHQRAGEDEHPERAWEDGVMRTRQVPTDEQEARR